MSQNLLQPLETCAVRAAKAHYHSQLIKKKRSMKWTLIVNLASFAEKNRFQSDAHDETSCRENIVHPQYRNAATQKRIETSEHVLTSQLISTIKLTG